MEETNQKPTQQKNTGMAIIAYIIFFVPLLTDAKNDPFVKFHVKQGLTLLITGIIVWILSSFLPWSLWRIGQLLDLFVFVLMIIGIMNASKGEEKPLPIIGKFAENFKF
ncbi:MAG: hypothetical protein PHE59_01690 [Patescibacteria group bacterium]|nr:hypothetical protein [Patescibacteria group bacterium]MDD5164900.1 hypothetical protein [Patescibacteria group bacterium]MDD5534705.1 hypothetical protein [Patescibacteria group bacterium]